MAEPFKISGPHSRPRGMYVVAPLDNHGAYKGCTAYACETFGGRWSRQAGGYVMSPAAVARLRAHLAQSSLL